MTHSRVIHIFEKIQTKFRPKFPTFRLILLINCTIGLNCVCLCVRSFFIQRYSGKKGWKISKVRYSEQVNFINVIVDHFEIYIYLTLHLNLQHFCTRHLFFATSIPFAFSSHVFTTRCIRVCDRFNLKIVQKQRSV